MKKKIIVTTEKDLKKAIKKVKKNQVIIFDERKPTVKELKAWANQDVVIKCKMHQAGDLMDILFMADTSPLDNAFRDTLKINKMTKPYYKWLNKMVDIVCPEIKNLNKRTRRKK